jgi:antitoxin MazE
MKIDLVRIGNSRGIRIPKPIIAQCGLGETVDLRVENDCLIISPGRQPRRGWEQAFRGANGASSHHTASKTMDDELLLEGTEPNEFDHKEWRW